MSEITTDIIDEFPDQIPWDKLEPETVILDRSTLERWAECPHQAALMALHKINIANEDTETGTACHDIIAEAIKKVVLTDDRIIRPGEFADDLIDAAKRCDRTDLQPRVCRVMQSCAWTVARIICERSAADIMRFDGGHLAYSGQIAADIMPGVRITCELDLLMATPSKEELDLYDWKSGWKRWTATDVRDSFQFTFYAWLILKNYPAVERVFVRIAMLADNDVTGAVAFERRYMDQYAMRIRTAITHYQHEANPADAPAWPTPTKCATCDAARHCKYASDISLDVSEDPAEAIRRLVATEAAATRVRKYLTARVRETGKDIVVDLPDGQQIAFGTNKPKASRAIPCDVYEIPPG